MKIVKKSVYMNARKQIFEKSYGVIDLSFNLLKIENKNNDHNFHIFALTVM